LSTAEASTEAFFRSEFETAKGVIDVAGVDARVSARHGMGPLPERL